MRKILYYGPDGIDVNQYTALKRVAYVSSSAAFILTSSEAYASVQAVARECDIVVVDGMNDIRREPAAAANLILKTVCESDVAVIGVVGKHSPQNLRVLSLVSAWLSASFIGGLRASALPYCERGICANGVVERLDTPQGCFCATLGIESVCDSVAGDVWSMTADDDMRLKAANVRLPEPRCVQFESFDDLVSGLDGARIVFGGGKGLGCQKNFERMAHCARLYGAGVGASRLAVDMGWCRNDCQVGQTGRTIAPDVYVAFGISGAIQHLSGMKQSRLIIAVNKDREAPIFSYCDYGILGDAVSVIEALIERKMVSRK